MNIALVSLNQLWEDKVSNYNQCKNYIINASNRNANLIIFPEMTLTGFSMNIKKNAEEDNSSETIKKFIQLAKEYNIAIIFGLTIKSTLNKGLNTAIFIDNNGDIKSKYVKIHPFSFANEDKYFTSGEDLKKINYFNFDLSLTICYDLRFPEIYSALAKDCNLIINIANWPRKRIDHWKVLLKARAIENQIYLIGVNRTGKDGNNLEYIESSDIISPNGEILSPIFKDEKLKIYTVDKNYIQDFKNNFNTTKDRKTDLYKKVL